MASLKSMITDIVTTEFRNMDKKEQTILSSLAFLKVATGSYYKEQYYTTSLAILKNKYGAIHSNESNDVNNGKANFRRCLYNLHDEYDYPNFDRVNSVQHYFVKPEIIDKLNDFHDIVKNSYSVDEYVDNLIEVQKRNKDFLPLVKSFGFLFEKYEDDILNNEICIKFKDRNFAESISSTLCNNYISLYHPSLSGKIIDDNELNEKWLSSKQEKTKIIKRGISKLKNIENMFSLYKDQLSFIEDNIYENKPFLKEQPDINKVEFFYFELKSGEYRNPDIETNNDIKEDVLNKHNIRMTNLKSYEDAENFFLNKENDLSNYFEPKYYGLDYVNEQALQVGDKNRSYIVAKYDNETVGYFSFSSSANNNESTIKKINNICVKNNFRGMGLAKILYDKVAKVFIDSNKILYNSMYSEQGKYKLPDLKTKIREQNPEFLMFDTDIGNVSEGKEKIFNTIKNFNIDFLIDLSEAERMKPLKVKESVRYIKKIYDESIKYMLENKDFFSVSSNYQGIGEYKAKQLEKMHDLIYKNNTVKLKMK